MWSDSGYWPSNNVTLSTGFNVGGFQLSCFRISEINLFSFVVVICDKVHALEAMYGLP